MSITIYGSSDDLIEVEGDIREEFVYDEHGDNYIAASNGTVVGITYADNGFWIIRHITGPAVATVPGDDEDTNYSDRCTIHGDIAWVMIGQIARRK